MRGRLGSWPLYEASAGGQLGRVGGVLRSESDMDVNLWPGVLPLFKALLWTLAAVLAVALAILAISCAQHIAIPEEDRPALLTIAANNYAAVMPRQLWHLMAPVTYETLRQRALTLTDGVSTDFKWGMDGAAKSRLLHILDAATSTEATTSFGEATLSSLTLAGLTNRLQISSLLDHPVAGSAIRRKHVESPIIVVGLPRSGTTAFHRILSAHPSLRPLRWFEAMWPAGLSGMRAEELQNAEEDPRIAYAELFRTLYMSTMPTSFSRVHQLSTNDPEECLFLTRNSFDTGEVGLLNTMLDAEAVPQNDTLIYQYHKLQLQIQQWIRPDLSDRRWCLKAPAHLGRLQQLFEVYPDAYVVWVHRKPFPVASSYALLKSMLLTTVRKASKREIGSLATRALYRTMKKAMADRDRLPAHAEERIIDIHYQDFVSDPMGTICRVIDFAGLDCANPDAYAALSQSAAVQGHIHKRAKRQRPNKFGLDNDTISTLFEEYTDRFWPVAQELEQQ